MLRAELAWKMVCKQEQDWLLISIGSVAFKQFARKSGLCIANSIPSIQDGLSVSKSNICSIVERAD